MFNVKSFDAPKESAAMLTKQISKIFLCVAVLAVTRPAFCESVAAPQLAAGSSLWLVGDSTLHPFTNRTVDGVQSMEIDPARLSGSTQAGDALLKPGAVKTYEFKV